MFSLLSIILVEMNSIELNSALILGFRSYLHLQTLPKKYSVNKPLEHPGHVMLRIDSGYRTGLAIGLPLLASGALF